MDLSHQRPAVFWARTPTELGSAAARVRRDLEDRGVPVVASLESSSLAVHLLTGKRTHDAGVNMDLKVSLAYSREHPDFPLLIWAPPAAEGEDLLLDLMPRAEELAHGTEIVRGAIEDFKSLIYDRMKAIREPLARGLEATSGSQLYLIFDTQDQEAAKPVRDFFAERGVHVLIADAESATQSSALREKHNEYLRSCDAALIIYGNVREPWVRMKQQDLLRAAALGRKKVLAAKAVYLCAQITPPKQTFSAPGIMILREDIARHEFAQTFAPFITSLEAVT